MEEGLGEKDWRGYKYWTWKRRTLLSSKKPKQEERIKNNGDAEEEHKEMSSTFCHDTCFLQGSKNIVGGFKYSAKVLK